MTDPTVVIVGGGPRGTGLIERLAANAPLIAGGQPVRVHVVEPFTPGAGRIWRRDQSHLLWANSQAVDMTMFTDDSCVLDGPVRPGPTFLEWAQLPGVVIGDDEELEAQRRAVHAMTFPSRPLLSAYLQWSFEQAVSWAGSSLSVEVHEDRAVRLLDRGDGRQEVRLASGAVLVADVVLLAQGHLGRLPSGSSASLAAEAASLGLTYVPETFTSEVDVSSLPADSDVIVRGAGLAFVDLLVRVTQGRGGSYSSSGADGRLRYTPSGLEPRLHVGSRRGVPYHSKITYGSLRAPLPEARFLTETVVSSLLSQDGDRDFRQDVYPLLAKELAYRHYWELFSGHPGRVRGSWSSLLSALDSFSWGSSDLRAAVEAAVPDPGDRFEPERLDHPLAGTRLPDHSALQEHLKSYVRADIDRRADPRFSPDLAVFLGLLAVLGPVGAMTGSGRLSAASTVRDLPWFMGFFSYLASGPPPRRLEELIALMDAGVLHFLGADVSVSLTPEGFVATSPSAPGVTVAPILVEARIPRPTVRETADELLADLYDRGAVTEKVLSDGSGVPVPTGLVNVTPAEGQVIDASGHVHPARYALGSGTSSATPGAFSRPGTNAAFFRQNDVVSRSVLRLLTSLTVADRRAG